MKRPAAKRKAGGSKGPARVERARIVVAGHICLDVIPAFLSGARLGAPILAPGRLTRIGAALPAAGGVVSNTGLALRRLGLEPRLLGRIGDDWIGREILALLRAHGPRLADDLRIVPGDQSSYTIVLSPPGVDRIFLHYPGANDAFSAADAAPARLGSARLFHFGYPPLMRRMYRDSGKDLALIFRRARRSGLLTSLDMAGLDDTSEAGRVDWDDLLRSVLPHVDLFLPSLGDAGVGASAGAGGSELRAQAERWLGYGAAAAGLKLGRGGFYLRTTADRSRLTRLARAVPLRPEAWRDRELLIPSFKVRVAGTTGAGDCAMAGFLAALMRGLGPEDALRSAAAAGACCVEKPDAVSGVPGWTGLWKRLDSRWSRHPVGRFLPGWRWDRQLRLWRGPGDGERART